MLTKKQLEDASKCELKGSCNGCSLADGKGVGSCIKRPSQTALAIFDMLKRLDKAVASYRINCPLCFSDKGHSKDCELGILLKEVEG